jgi:hypothetical protein
MNAEAIQDAVLVRRFNGGDESAFGEIMKPPRNPGYSRPRWGSCTTTPTPRRSPRTRSSGPTGGSPASGAIPRSPRGSTGSPSTLRATATGTSSGGAGTRRCPSTPPWAVEGDSKFSDLLSAADPGPAQEARETSSWTPWSLHGAARAGPPQDPHDAHGARPVLRGDRLGARDQCRHRQEPHRPRARAPAQPPGRGMPRVRPRRDPSDWFEPARGEGQVAAAC